MVASKSKKRKVTIAYNSDDSDEREKTQQKTTFDSDSDDAISEIVSN